MGNWKSREADKLWEYASQAEKSGASFKAKQSEINTIRQAMEKVGGVKKDPDRGELSLMERIERKLKTDPGKELNDRILRQLK